MTTATSATSATNPAPIRIRALGGFAIDIDGVPVQHERRTPQRPLAVLQSLLSLSAGRTMSARAASEALWPDAEDFDAYRALVTNVHRLRRLLRHSTAVRYSGQTLSLDPHLVWVDAWAFERELADGQSLPRLLEALDLYRGHFLGDVEHPHVFEARERLQRKFVRGIQHAGQKLTATGDVASAIALYERALDLGSTSEDLHRELMQCLIRAGQPGAAAQIFARCRALLARHFGISPSAATIRTLQSIAL